MARVVAVALAVVLVPVVLVPVVLVAGSPASSGEVSATALTK